MHQKNSPQRLSRRTFLKGAAAGAAGLLIPARLRSLAQEPNPISAPAAGGQIIADHAVVDQYDDIPQGYMDEVKKMWFNLSGESHSTGYRNGLGLLQTLDSRYQASINASNPPEGNTDQHLRVSPALRNAYNNWNYSCGEANWYTNANAIQRIKDHLAYCNSHDLPIAAIGFGWCWDMTWHNTPGGTEDPAYQVRWAGSSESGPQGDLRWGLDSGDQALTGNSVCMDTYLSATQQYVDYCLSQGYPTRVLFTTGPVDGYTGESGYQRYLKHEHLRNYVKASADRILFDYADILCWSDAGQQKTITWAETGKPTRTFQHIHDDNMLDLDGSAAKNDGDHIGERGALRLGKAVWWLLARIAGWDGIPATYQKIYLPVVIR